jgi:F-type H+-transporting ATPase subunit delta
MMKTSVLENRYAKAIFDASLDDPERKTCLNELTEISSQIFSDKEIMKVFQSPTVPRTTKIDLVEKVLQQSKLSGLTQKVMRLLAHKDRLVNLGGIAKALQDTIDASEGINRGKVKSVSQVSTEDRARIESAISKVTGKKVQLEYTVDQALIGGLVAQVGSYCFDDSIDTQLHTLTDDLKRRTQ